MPSMEEKELNDEMKKVSLEKKVYTPPHLRNRPPQVERVASTYSAFGKSSR